MELLSLLVVLPFVLGQVQPIDLTPRRDRDPGVIQGLLTGAANFFQTQNELEQQRIQNELRRRRLNIARQRVQRLQNQTNRETAGQQANIANLLNAASQTGPDQDTAPVPQATPAPGLPAGQPIDPSAVQNPANVQLPSIQGKDVNLQDPDTRRMGQIAAQEVVSSPRAAPSQAITAGQALGMGPQQSLAVQQSSVGGPTSEDMEKFLQTVPERIRPLVRTVTTAKAAGVTDNTLLETIIEEQRENLSPSAQDELDRQIDRANVRLKNARADKIRNALKSGPEGQAPNKGQLLVALGAATENEETGEIQVKQDRNSQTLAAMDPDDLSAIAREQQQFIQNPGENAFNMMEQLMGRTDPATGEPMFTFGQALNQLDRLSQSSGLDWSPADLSSRETTKLRLQGAVRSVIGSAGIPSGADIEPIASQVAQELRTLRLPEDVTTKDKVDAIVQGIRSSPGGQDIDEGRIRQAALQALNNQ